MARNKDSRFGVAEGFDFNDQYEKDTQEAQYVQEVNIRSITMTNFVNSILREKMNGVKK